MILAARIIYIGHMTSQDTSHKLREDGLGWEMKMKVVGKPRPHDPAAALHWNMEMLKLSPNLGKWHPRGVFRFKTWEAFEEWQKHQKTNSCR